MLGWAASGLEGDHSDDEDVSYVDSGTYLGTAEVMEPEDKGNTSPANAASSIVPGTTSWWWNRCKNWATSKARRAFWGDKVPIGVDMAVRQTLIVAETPELLPGTEGPLPEFATGNESYTARGRMRIVGQLIADLRFQFGSGREKMTQADRLTRRQRAIRLIEEYIEDRRKADEAAGRAESMRKCDQNTLRLSIEIIVSASYVPSIWDIEEREMLGSQAVADRFEAHERKYGSGGILGRLVHPWDGPTEFRKV